MQNTSAVSRGAQVPNVPIQFLDREDDPGDGKEDFNAVGGFHRASPMSLLTVYLRPILQMSGGIAINDLVTEMKAQRAQSSFFPSLSFFAWALMKPILVDMIQEQNKEILAQGAYASVLL